MQSFDRPYDDSESQTLRGFQALVVTDGHQTLGETTHDLAIIERIEVSKGSSAILFPQGGSPGGTINLITKAPQDKEGGYLRVQGGQFNANKVELDYNGTPLDKGKLLYRFVFSDQDSDGFSETEYTKRTVFFPSVAYKFSDNTKLTLKYEHVHGLTTSPTGQGMGPHGEDGIAQGIVYFDFSLPKDRSFDDPDQNKYTKTEDQYWVTLESKLSDTLAFRAGGHYADTYDDRLGTRPAYQPGFGQPAIPNAPIIAPDGTVQRLAFEPQWHRHNYLAFVDTTSVFSLLKTNHTVMLGAKYTSTEGDTKQPGGFAFPATNAFLPPVSGLPNVVPSANWQPDTNGWWTEAYVMDVIKFWQDRICLNLGITQNWVQNINYHSDTKQYSLETSRQDVKQYGILVQPVKDVYVYASFNENYNPSSSILGVEHPDGSVTAGGIAPSEFNTSKEAGVKVRLNDGRLTANFAVYDIELTNRTENILNSNYARLLTSGTSKGWEGDLMYAPNNNVTIIGTFAHINAVDNDGIRFTDVPRYTASGWARYDFRKGTLKGLGLAAGFTYCDSMQNSDRGVRFNYAGRTLVNGGIYYDLKAIRFQLNFTNLFDKDYYAGGSPPQISYRGERRNIQGSITYKF
jgi:iron complex outermembrane receptor protein